MSMSPAEMLAAVLSYALGLILIAGGAAAFVLARAKLLLVNLWLRLTTGRPLDLLSGLDATLQFSTTTYFSQPECPTVITAVMTFKGSLDIGAFQKRFREQVIRARNPTTGRLINKRWTHRVERRFGFFVWTPDASFDIRQHIRIHEATYADDNDLVKVIQKTCHNPLPHARPPWEFFVVNKMSADECAVVYRVHHSLADGLNLVLSFHLLVDGATAVSSESVNKENDAKQSNLSKRNPLLHLLFKSGQKFTVNAVADALWNLLSIALSAPYIIAQVVLQKPERNALHGPELCGRKLLALSTGIRFQVMKDISKAFNCCINDVFHYGITAAIQRCNEESPEVPADSHMTLLVPLYMMRPGDTWTQNTFTFTFLRYPLRAKSPQQHLREIAEVTNAMKSSAEPLMNFVVTQGLSNHVPLTLAKKCLAPSFDYTAMATNVVGPPNDLLILGLPVTSFFFFPINHGRAGISVSMISLNGCVRIGVTADRSVTPDDGLAQRLADHFESEIQTLHQLALEDGHKLLNNF